jgi:hypothetical protein
MKKKTLEEKIKRVGFWTFGGVFWYLVIAFFLKSNYPIYEYNIDRSAAYDIIKDALTLAAAFLAPVAAFVLFSDWREPHVEKIIEDDSSKIYEGANNAINELLRILFEIEDEDNFKENNNSIPAKLIDELYGKIENLNRLSAHLGARGAAPKKFTECAADLLGQISFLNVELDMLCAYQLKIQNPHVHNDLNCDDQDFAEKIQESYDGQHSQILRTFPALRTLEGKLKALCDELKIRA